MGLISLDHIAGCDPRTLLQPKWPNWKRHRIQVPVFVGSTPILGTPNTTTTKVMVKDMAKKFILIDDLDGESVATKTVQFEAFGRRYTIDLNDEHANELNAVLSKYASVATEIVAPNRIAAKSIRTPAELNEIRQWARSEGHNVSDKGRIPESVIRKFEHAQEKARLASQKPVESTEEAPKDEETPETVETPQETTEATKPIPVAEFSAELPPVVTTNAKNTGKSKAGVK